MFFYKSVTTFFKKGGSFLLLKYLSQRFLPFFNGIAYLVNFLAEFSLQVKIYSYICKL